MKAILHKVHPYKNCTWWVEEGRNAVLINKQDDEPKHLISDPHASVSKIYTKKQTKIEISLAWSI